MSWREFQGWIATMNRQIEGQQVSPDSWAGADTDQWWVEARRERDAERRR